MSREEISEPASEQKPKQKDIATTLVTVGGVITLVVGILEALIGALLTLFALGIGGIIGVWGILCGAILLWSARMMRRSDDAKAGAALAMVFSVLALISLQGVVVGPVLALAGGIVKLFGK